MPGGGGAGGCIQLNDEGFTHHAVSHSDGFVDTRTGAHVHKIEATWKHVKVQLSPYNRKTQYIYRLGGSAAHATWI